MAQSSNTPKLIEIHMVQNHPPANLNRDDLGAPKTCMFGGALRARISSQCLKRSIRNPGNPENIHNRGPGLFAEAMASSMGLRTQLFPWLVGQALDHQQEFLPHGAEPIPPEEHTAIVAACKSVAKKEDKGGTQQKKKGEDTRPRTPQVIFLGPRNAEEFVKRLQELRAEQREHYNFFLDPRATFEALIEGELEKTTLAEDEQKKALKGAWLLAKYDSRLEKLLRIDDDGVEEEKPHVDENSGQPGEEYASFIAERLADVASQHPKLFKALVSTKRKKGEPELPKERKEPRRYKEDFRAALRAANKYDAVDIALFGRMTTSDAFEDCEAAMQVAHAISTHELTNEVDYFTTVDDRSRGPASGYLGENQFNSACFYKYFSLDWEQLVANLTPPDAHDEARAAARKLAAATVGHFILAAAQESPTGKQNSFASHCRPAAILVEIKARKTPTSYANAFAEPARRLGPPPDEALDAVSLVGRSIAQLGNHVAEIRESYGSDSTLLWQTSALWRYPLQGYEREEDGRLKKDKKGNPIAKGLTEQLFNRLQTDENGVGIVDALIEHLGESWNDIRDVGRSSNEEA